jgi:hypothetical protein
MNNSLLRKEIIIISIYKSIEDSLRYTFGILLIIFNFNLYNLTFNLFKRELAEDPSDFFFRLIVNHTRQPPIYLAKILAIVLILFSLLEISFLIGLILRRKWGAIGFFCMQFLWAPVDLLIISKFLLFSKIITIIFELIIIARLLISPRGYFKK